MSNKRGNMNALYDFIPGFCPNCGKKASSFTIADYYTHLTHFCSCGLNYQLISQQGLLEAAGKEGDLPKFA